MLATELPDPNPSGLCFCGCGQQTPIATKTYAHRNLVRGKHHRYIHGHNVRKRVRYLPENKGYSSPCWIWQLKTNHGGYGQFAVQQDGERHEWQAHRYYYTEAYGEISPGYQIDHKCNQRNCVNPDHLVAVTPAQNLWRMFMTKAGLTSIQIDLLYQWVLVNLTPEQQRAIWHVD